MAVLAVTIMVYAELPDDSYISTLSDIKQGIAEIFDVQGLDHPVIRHKGGIPTAIADLL